MAVILNSPHLFTFQISLMLTQIAIFVIAISATVYGEKDSSTIINSKNDDDLCPAAASEGWGLPDEPVQLVKPDLTHKKLVIVEENVKYLHRIMGPVATIAVVGKFHSGKSFFMNQLMGKSKGFGVGFTVRPQTMGIWMWGKPIDMVLSSGKKVSVIFLDTEGFAANNVSENYDAKIFAISTLLSSHLIYNSVKIIDQADIDYLELLARRTQLFALRSQMSKSKWTEFNHDLLSFPPLLWVVQDFVQVKEEGQTPKDWLHKLMDTHTREAEDYEISLLGIFKSVDCHTLFLPSADKVLLSDLSRAEEHDLTPDYRKDRDELIVKIQDELVPKEKNHEPITGPEFATLLEILVQGANDGSLAEVPSRWDVFINRLEETAVEDCYRFYIAEMEILQRNNKSGPVIPDKLQEWHKHVLKQSMKLLQQLLFGLGDSIDQASRSLLGLINTEYIRSRDLNEKKIRLKCTEVLRKIELLIEDKFSQIKLPTATKNLEKRADELALEAEQKFTDAVNQFISAEILESYLKALKNFVQSVSDSTILKNKEAMETLLEKSMAQSIELFKERTANSNQIPRLPTILDALATQATEAASNNFINLITIAKDEVMYSAYQALFKAELQAAVERIHVENEKLVLIEGKKIVGELLNTVEESTSSVKIPLPMNTSELNNRLERESKRVCSSYSEFVHPYIEYSGTRRLSSSLKAGLDKVFKKRRQENVDAFTREVSTPLNTAKKIILLSVDKYTTLFSVKQYIQDVCLLNLNEGKAKYWPFEFKFPRISRFLDE